MRKGNVVRSIIWLLLSQVAIKLGIELGYGSDLDLVFIHYMDEQADTDVQSRLAVLNLQCVLVQN